MPILMMALALTTVATPAGEPPAGSATSLLWSQQKVRNYLPDMTWPGVADLLTRTDMVVISAAAQAYAGIADDVAFIEAWNKLRPLGAR